MHWPIRNVFVPHCRSTREDLGARTPDSEEDDNSPPASASSKAKAKPARSSRTTSSGHSQMQTPLPSGDRNKKDKGLREFSLRVCRQVEVRLVLGQNSTTYFVPRYWFPCGTRVGNLPGRISMEHWILYVSDSCNGVAGQGEHDLQRSGGRTG